MCRRATGTPIVAATVCCESRAMCLCLHSEPFRIPREAELRGRRHVADQRGRRDDRRTGEIALAANAHAVLPVAIEGRDRALPLSERIGTLSEARPAPGLANLSARRPKYMCDRVAAEPRVGPLDLARDAAGPGKNHELLHGMRDAAIAGGADHERRAQEVVVAAIRTRTDERLVEREM